MFFVKVPDMGGGISTPLSVIEQITYLLFIKRLDGLHTLEERKAQTLEIEMEREKNQTENDQRTASAILPTQGRMKTNLRSRNALLNQAA